MKNSQKPLFAGNLKGPSTRQGWWQEFPAFSLLYAAFFVVEWFECAQAELARKRAIEGTRELISSAEKKEAT